MDRKLEKALDALDVPHALEMMSSTFAQHGQPIVVRSPIDGSILAKVPSATASHVEHEVRVAVHDFPVWRDTPSPVRGELVRRVGARLRDVQEDLATVVAWEAGKIL